MQNAEMDGRDVDVCELCQEPLRDGETVVQVVQDRHPTYDRELVLHTYHLSCCRNRQTVTHRCSGCGCWFHLALLKEGMKRPSSGLLCPFCGRPFSPSEG